jgi:hypothetical protein
MHSIYFVDFSIIRWERLRHSTRDIFLLATTAWFFIFAAQMTLGAGLACLYYSSVASYFSFLSFGGRV